jgi:DNA-binding GntR family transcriptional regulator
MKLTASAIAYKEIKEKIIRVNMRPGSVINEADLMTELSLGRTPIREALKQLQAESLIVVSPRRGMYVADIAITDLIQLHEVRIEVESNCARLAAKRISKQKLQEIKKLVCDEQQLDKFDMDELIALDRHFHSMIAEAAENRFLYKDWENYYNLSLRIWYLILNDLKPEDVGVDDHTGIVEALEEGDEKNADIHMRRHIVHFYETVKGSL